MKTNKLLLKYLYNKYASDDKETYYNDKNNEIETHYNKLIAGKYKQDINLAVKNFKEANKETLNGNIFTSSINLIIREILKTTQDIIPEKLDENLLKTNLEGRFLLDMMVNIPPTDKFIDNFIINKISEMYFAHMERIQMAKYTDSLQLSLYLKDLNTNFITTNLDEIEMYILSKQNEIINAIVESANQNYNNKTVKRKLMAPVSNILKTIFSVFKLIMEKIDNDIQLMFV